MRWPWSKELDEARAGAAQAHREAMEAQRRRIEAQRKAEQARRTATKLRAHLEANGWTELLTEAWGKR